MVKETIKKLEDNSPGELPDQLLTALNNPEGWTTEERVTVIQHYCDVYKDLSKYYANESDEDARLTYQLNWITLARFLRSL
jgi:hypothetical protein